MIEYDQESYNRKFVDTVTVFNTKKGLDAFWIKDLYMENEEDGIKLYLYGTKKETIPCKPIKEEPIYHRFKRGIYQLKSGGWCSIRRKVTKSFKIGLSHDNYHIVKYNPQLFEDIHPLDVDVLGEVKLDIETALSKEGPISDTLYLSKNAVFYLNQNMGIRKGSKFMINEAIQQELSDALREHKCSILV